MTTGRINQVTFLSTSSAPVAKHEEKMAKRKVYSNGGFWKAKY